MLVGRTTYINKLFINKERTIYIFFYLYKKKKGTIFVSHMMHSTNHTLIKIYLYYNTLYIYTYTLLPYALRSTKNEIDRE